MIDCTKKHSCHLRLLTPLLMFMALSLYADNNIMRHYFNRVSRDASRPYKERLDACDSLVVMAPTSNERRTVLMTKGKLLYDLGLLHQADKIYEELMKEGGFSSVSEQCAVLLALVKTGIFRGDYRRSLNMAHKLKNLRKPDSLRYYDAEAFYAQGAVWGRFDLMERSEEMARKALETLEAAKKSLTPGKVAEMRAKIYILQSANSIRLKKYNEAFAFLDRAEAVVRTPEINLLVNLNRAVVYQIMGKPEIATRYYEHLLGNGRLIHYNTGLAANNYLSVLAAKGRGKEAMELYSRNRDVLDLLQGTEGEAQLHRNMANLYASLGDYRKAYDEHQGFIRVVDSIGNANLRLQLDSDSAEEQLRLSDGNGTLWLTVIVIALVVLLSLALLMYIHRLRQRRMATSDACRSLPQLSIGEEDSVNIQALNCELTSMALRLASATEALKTIRDDVGDDTTDDAGKLEALRRDLLGVKLQHDVWESFDKYFARMYPGYISALCKSHPTLTAGELRMCSFIALNLSTKDIAAITNRSTRTVEATKYRLVKKLAPKESLGTYLRRFLQY